MTKPATKEQRIKALKLQGWADDLIQRTVGCSSSYLKRVLVDLKHELANGHHQKAG
jgi:AraC-like DNA-binding protein